MEWDAANSRWVEKTSQPVVDDILEEEVSLDDFQQLPRNLSARVLRKGLLQIGDHPRNTGDRRGIMRSDPPGGLPSAKK